MKTMGSMVGHIHLDKHTFDIFFLLKKQHMMFYYLFLLIVTVYTFMQINLFKFTKQQRVVFKLLSIIHITFIIHTPTFSYMASGPNLS
jgi:hypothetical protein